MSKTTTPNILFIMADQLTPFMTGAYGNDLVKTPNLDRLCREGIRYDAAYTSCPLCAPARASMMTSKYVSDLECYDNATHFSCAEPTFAHYLKNAGYDVTLSGKMHFIGPDQLHGFTKRLTTDIYPSDFSWYPVPKASFPNEDDPTIGHKANYPESWFSKYSDPLALANNYRGELVFPTEANLYVNFDEEVFFRAKEYLHANWRWDPTVQPFEGRPEAYAIGKRKVKEPFCLTVSTHNPHDPFLPPKKYWEMYKDVVFDVPTRAEMDVCPQNIQDTWINVHHNVSGYDLSDPFNTQNARRAYAALATYVDDRIGELIGLLEDDELLENTVILFTSDHGDMLMERGMVQKRNLHEWANRIPMIMRLPNQEYAGTVVTEPCSIVDVGMTLRDVTNTLDVNSLKTDGISLLDYVREPESVKNRDIFIEFHSDGTFWPCYAIINGDYKLIYIHQYKGQLFNLKDDPKEMNDLIDDPQYAEIIESMQQKILDRFEPQKIIDYYNEAHIKKDVIDSGNSKFKEHWDYTPEFPGNERYLRTIPID